ncbi:MAG TPA: hypothetical protein RMH99_29030 [Sandaracinaceae bacterium LLY-WYZ-13_1]|nr:hypothetical protein [Sandaracinaceae bacterium LLY-WYZ-13_1]
MNRATIALTVLATLALPAAAAAQAEPVAALDSEERAAAPSPAPSPPAGAEPDAGGSTREAAPSEAPGTADEAPRRERVGEPSTDPRGEPGTPEDDAPASSGQTDAAPPAAPIEEADATTTNATTTNATTPTAPDASEDLPPRRGTRLPRAVVDTEAERHPPAPDGEASAPWPDRIGPFQIGDDIARLRVSLFAQLQLRIDDREQAAGERTTDARVLVRRIRPILRGAFLDGRIQSTLHLEVAPGSMELIDLYVDGTILPELHLRAGQFKVPFTQYWQQSLVNLSTVDWPLTSRWFGGERQFGLMAHNQHRNPSGVQYALGLFAGENRRGAYARELPRLYGESHGNPSSLTDPRAPGDFHAEIIGRIGHFAADVHPETLYDVSGGGFRHGVALSAAWDSGPEHRRDWALRVAPEVLLKWEGLSFTAVGYLGLVETMDRSMAPGGIGFITELGWQVHRHVQIGVRYARVSLFDDLVDDAAAYAGSLEPTDPELHEDWASQYGDVGHLRARHELSLAVHVPIIGRSLSLASDVSWMRSERDDGDRDDVRVRVQLQLAF